MIKVPKESISAYHVPQLAALVLNPAYSSRSFVNWPSFDRVNNSFSLRTISISFLHASAFCAFQSTFLEGSGGSAKPPKGVHLTALLMSTNLLRIWAIDSTLSLHQSAIFGTIDISFSRIARLLRDSWNIHSFQSCLSSLRAHFSLSPPILSSKVEAVAYCDCL